MDALRLGLAVDEWVPPPCPVLGDKVHLILARKNDHTGQVMELTP